MDDSTQTIPLALKTKEATAYFAGDENRGLEEPLYYADLRKVLRQK